VAKTKWFATEKLREFREHKGYTQQEMADFLSLEFGRNISVSLYQQWETGVQPLQPEQILDLARVARVDYKVLVEQKDAGTEPAAAIT
jgi:transcriptional regulator with XRE-family HTH domain